MHTRRAQIQPTNRRFILGEGRGGTGKPELVNGVLDATPAGEIAIYLADYVPVDYVGSALPEDSDAS